MNDSTISINQNELLEQTKNLIRGCISGDRHSQATLYNQFAPKMFALCMRYSRSREEAEDVLQEGFIQVYKSLHSFKFDGSFEGWIRKIMVYSAIASFRSKSNLHVVMKNIENFSDIEVMDTEDIISILSKKELLNMVQVLPPMYRLVFNLYIFEGLKHREIAKQLGVSEGTSKSNFHDAKVILQRAVISSMKIAKQNSSNG